MSEYKDYRKFILEKLDERTLLEQLAEEASEVVQAALKLIRAKRLNNNVTPKTEQEAMLNLMEEIEDFSIVITLLYRKDTKLLTTTGVTKWQNKWKRWAERLGYKEVKQ